MGMGISLSLEQHTDITLFLKDGFLPHLFISIALLKYFTTEMLLMLMAWCVAEAVEYKEYYQVERNITVIECFWLITNVNTMI